MTKDLLKVFPVMSWKVELVPTKFVALRKIAGESKSIRICWLPLSGKNI